MKKIVFTIFCVSTLLLSAQSPVIKVDFNEPSRANMDEVLEPGFTPWPARKDGLKDSLTVDGVKFIVTSKNNGYMRVGWNKAFVQTKENNARLLGDGLNFDPSRCGGIELAIVGLPVGSHSIQTYHNSWNDSATVAGYPMSVFLNGKMVHEQINRTYRVTVAADATVLLTNFIVDNEGDTVKIEFVTYDSIKPTVTKSKYDYTPMINAFELNTVSAVALAKRPVPADANMHVDADSGWVEMRWSPADSNVVKHYLYIGYDSVSVAAADTTSELFRGAKLYGDTTYLLDGTYCLNTYYWRVDELSENGTVTPGTIWSFRPRRLAFRGAEGYGRYATGGRGGKVIEVTNLNPSGPGSLYDAVTNETGPRTIVFCVSGVIPLAATVFADDNITIAGQTAPGKGICMRQHSFGIGNETICRFVRLRLGSGNSTDGMGMAGSSESIYDHCSISWSIDEGFSSRNAKNITVQKTMISEALNIAGLDNYEEGHAHGYAAVVGGDIASFHHNLLAHCHGRNPRLDGGIDGNGKYMGRVDIFNNIIYNWDLSSAYGEAMEANFVNNYYKQGPATDIDRTTLFVADVNQREINNGSESYYARGNVLIKKDGTYTCKGENTSCGVTTNIHGNMVIDWTILVDKPFFPSYATIETAHDAYKSVLSDVGCTMPIFDDHDQRIIKETLSGTYTYTGSKGNTKGIIDDEADCGGYEDYGTEVRPADFDTDHDGLPNWWEALYGSNPNSAAGDFSDSNADPDHDGYTALEDYLEWMSVPHYYMSKNDPKEIELGDYAVSYTKNPQYAQSYVSSDNIVLSFDASKVTVTPKADYAGISYFDFTVTDSENSSMTRRIGVYVEDSTANGISNVAAEKAYSISVYPTTFDRTLNIETKLAENSNISLVLRDMSGREVLRETYMLSAGNEQIQMNCPSNMASQMYLLEMNDAKTGMKYDVKRVLKK